MLEKLWNDIRLIYDGFNFSSKMIIDDLMIISRDNCYLLYYKPDGGSPTQIKIEKDFRLGLGYYSRCKKWIEKDITYQLHFEFGDQLDETYKIELAYKIINPFLRDFKLNKIVL
jgi:hypothetical protein